MLFLIKLITNLIPIKKYRRIIRNKLKTIYYGYDVIKNAKAVGKNFECEGFSYVTKNTVIGDNVRFNGVNINGLVNVHIGDYCQFGQEILIIAQNHNYDNGDAIPYDTTYIYKDIVINDFSWIGSRVIILPGTYIGEGAIIQAGAVVHGNIPAYSISGGNPAKVFKYRNIEHFKKLKEEKKFLINN